jgi:hypothetical protein
MGDINEKEVARLLDTDGRTDEEQLAWEKAYELGMQSGMETAQAEAKYAHGEEHKFCSSPKCFERLTDDQTTLITHAGGDERYTAAKVFRFCSMKCLASAVRRYAEEK